LKTVNQYKIKVSLSPEINAIGNGFCDVLGLLLREKFDGLDYTYFTPVSSLRKDLLLKKGGKPSHLISAFNFSSADNTVSFWLSESDFKSMSSKQWKLSLIRTDNWVVVSTPIDLSRAKPIKNQLFE
jgi:hypothetical protein